ncbi:hypothetical protein AwMethylo_01760 [Methylobacterium sp.]|nr:hypothetical protein AwMethylo_01760 [Methylobacterium sp.]
MRRSRIERAPAPFPLRGGGWPSRQRGSGAALSRRGKKAAVALATLLLATPALADDKAACAEGIGMIKAEIARAPAEPALGKLKKALRVAEREQGEAEYDECLDAVGDAKRALPK